MRRRAQISFFQGFYIHTPFRFPDPLESKRSGCRPEEARGFPEVFVCSSSNFLSLPGGIEDPKRAVRRIAARALQRARQRITLRFSEGIGLWALAREVYG